MTRNKKDPLIWYTRVRIKVTKILSWNGAKWGLFFNIATFCGPHTSSIGVTVPRYHWLKKSHRQQIWRHHMNFSTYVLFSSHSYLFDLLYMVGNWWRTIIPWKSRWSKKFDDPWLTQSSSNCLHNYRWINVSTQPCLLLYSFLSNLLHSLLYDW